jgi:hypothetical protein
MANWVGIAGSVRRFMTMLTDLLIKGRQAGLWQKGNGPDIKPR